MSEFGTNNKDTETLKSCLQESRTPTIRCCSHTQSQKEIQGRESSFRWSLDHKTFPRRSGLPGLLPKTFPFTKSQQQEAWVRYGGTESVICLTTYLKCYIMCILYAKLKKCTFKYFRLRKQRMKRRAPEPSSADCSAGCDLCSTVWSLWGLAQTWVFNFEIWNL